jgi:hypothetical protein
MEAEEKEKRVLTEDVGNLFSSVGDFLKILLLEEFGTV